MEEHRDAVAGADALRGERAGDAGHAFVQLDVRALDPVEDERDAVGQVLSTVHALTPGAP